MQNSADILNELRNFQTNRRKPQDILTESETRYGVPSSRQRLTGLRAAIGNTENLIRNVDPSVTGRTSGALVNEGARQRIIAQERQPLSEQFREESRALEGETASLADLSQRSLAEAQLAISDEDKRENTLRSLYQTAYQREQDEMARQERERAFQEQKRLAAAQASQLAGYFSGGTPQTPTAKPKATDPNQQVAYNDVYTRIYGGGGKGRQSDQELVSDFKATQQSANYGNPIDKIKVQLYQKYRPDLFLPVGNQYARYFMNTAPQKQALPGGMAGITRGLGF